MKSFWEKIDRRDDGCWLWTGAKNDRGYGYIWVNGKTVRAHRVSYEINKGPIRAGASLLHSCDNPSCVNPDHLKVGSHADNMADMARKGRAVSPPRKLSWNDVCAIRESNESRSELALKFNVSPDYITDIRSFKYRRAA